MNKVFYILIIFLLGFNTSLASEKNYIIKCDNDEITLTKKVKKNSNEIYALVKGDNSPKLTTYPKFNEGLINWYYMRGGDEPIGVKFELNILDKTFEFYAHKITTKQLNTLKINFEKLKNKKINITKFEESKKNIYEEAKKFNEPLKKLKQYCEGEFFKEFAQDKFLLPINISDGVLELNKETKDRYDLDYTFVVKNLSDSKRYKTTACVILYDNNNLEIDKYPAYDQISIGPRGNKKFISKANRIKKDFWNEVDLIKIYMSRFDCGTPIDKRFESISEGSNLLIFKKNEIKIKTNKSSNSSQSFVFNEKNKDFPWCFGWISEKIVNEGQSSVNSMNRKILNSPIIKKIFNRLKLYKNNDGNYLNIKNEFDKNLVKEYQAGRSTYLGYVANYSGSKLEAWKTIAEGKCIVIE